MDGYDGTPYQAQYYPAVAAGGMAERPKEVRKLQVRRAAASANRG
jgi:hypothetical protein